MASSVRNCPATLLGFLVLMSLPAPAVADLFKYQFRLEAYDHGNLVKTEQFVTIGESDQQAGVFASNKLAVWGQGLRDSKVSWTRLHAEPQGIVQLNSPTPARAETGVLKVKTILFGLGVREFRDREWAGVRGRSTIMEGFSVSLIQEIPGIELEYMAHIENKGDTSWVKAGELLRGAPDKVDIQVGPFMAGHKAAERVEGLAFRLKGEKAPQYHVWYRGHVENLGDTAWSKDGDFCGTRGRGLRLEAFVVILSNN